MRTRIAASLVLVCLGLIACSRNDYQCSDQMGCLEFPPGRPVVIGVILANTDVNTLSSQNFLASIKKAISDKGDLLGHPLELIQYDTNCSPEDIQKGAMEFINGTDLVAIIAPVCTQASQTALPFIINAGVAFLSPITNPAEAYTITQQMLVTIEHISVLQADRSLYIPRSTLLQAINPAEIKIFHP